MQQMELPNMGEAPAAVRRTPAKHHYDAGKTSEWYTPGDIIEAARATLGAIDLDPASCALANRTVRAERYFDRATGGLWQQWAGRVWLNPPYSDYRGQAAKWAAKLLAEHLAGRVAQGILLVNVSTAYQPAMQAISRVGLTCILNERTKFVNSMGAPQSSPTQANVIFYLGKRQQEFKEQFDGRLGVVLMPVT